MAGQDMVVADDSTWEGIVEKSRIPVAVMFFSPTCANCKVIEPYFDQFSEEFKGEILFVKLNIMSSPYIAERYGIMGTPTFKFFCQGRPVGEVVGSAYPALLKKNIEETLEKGPECVRSSSKIDYSMTGYA